MEQLIECVPNFSEGLDLSIIKQITDECEKVDGIKLLNVDPGKTTNRTVVTFVGNGLTQEINVEALKAGIYTIQIATATGNSSKQFVKK